MNTLPLVMSLLLFGPTTLPVDLPPDERAIEKALNQSVELDSPVDEVVSGLKILAGGQTRNGDFLYICEGKLVWTVSIDEFRILMKQTGVRHGRTAELFASLAKQAIDGRFPQFKTGDLITPIRIRVRLGRAGDDWIVTSAKIKKSAAEFKISKSPRKNDRKQIISIIGLFDFDRDGISDRNQLHERIANSGGTIDNEVDDMGVKKPANGTITPKTTMLLVGKLIDPSTVADPKDRKVAERILRHFHAMRDEARKAGVRVRDMNLFLTWSTSASRRRANPLFYDLPSKPDAAISRLYGNKRKLKPSASTGRSKRFGGSKN